MADFESFLNDLKSISKLLHDQMSSDSNWDFTSVLEMQSSALISRMSMLQGVTPGQAAQVNEIVLQGPWKNRSKWTVAINECLSKQIGGSAKNAGKLQEISN